MIDAILALLDVLDFVSLIGDLCVGLAKLFRWLTE